MSNIEALSILVVEDHDFQRMVLTGLLEDLGIQRIGEAADGHQALAELGRQTFDIIFLDLQMPGMDGVELLRQLAAHMFSGSVVLASAQDQSLIDSVRAMARLEKVRILGALEKPVTVGQIRTLLATHKVGPELPGYAVNELMTLAEVQRGLQEREMQPWYQPKMRFADGVMIGVEALVRWQHPEHGLLSPAAFIPVIEEHKLIDALTEIVTQCAVRQCAEWRASGLDLQVAINVAACTVSRPGFATYFAELIRGYGVSPKSITIELTESSLARDLSGCIGNLAQLRMNGFGISIDDFGTGYSSMSQLKEMPFTELKIDRSFVSGIVDSPSNRALARGSIQIASELGIRTVAEGVETWGEWHYMREIGADVCQGYLSGKPIPGAQIPDSVAPWKALFLANAGENAGQLT